MLILSIVSCARKRNLFIPVVESMDPNRRPSHFEVSNPLVGMEDEVDENWIAMHEDFIQKKFLPFCFLFCSLTLDVNLPVSARTMSRRTLSWRKPKEEGPMRSKV